MMRASETTGELFAALVKAQAEFPPVKRNRHAKIELRSGGTYEYDYADLGDMVEQFEPILAKYGLGVTGGPTQTTPHTYEDDRGTSTVFLVSVETVMLHASGEWISNETTLPVRSMDAQSFGSGITYARRYGFGAICGVAPQDADDDAQAAMRTPRKRGPITRPEGRQQDPGAYLFPIDKRYKGKPISEVPVEYLRKFIMGPEFDKEDIRAETKKYLDTLATPASLEWLIFAAQHVEHDVGKETVNAEKVADAVQGQVEQHGDRVPRTWFEAAEAAILGNIDDQRREDLMAQWESAKEEAAERGEE